MFDYSTTVDLQDFQVSDSLFSSPVSSGHNLRGASPHCHEDRKGGEGSGTQRHPHLVPSLNSQSSAMMDMQEKSHSPLPPITPLTGGISTSARHSFTHGNPYDLSASEEPLSLMQQVEQPAPTEQTVTTQPSSSRVAPQWLQPLNRGVPEGCEAGREKPLWLVPQHSTEPKSASSSSMLPELPCHPGRVCRGVERTVNGGQGKVDSLDLSCDLLGELRGEMTDRPISGRRSSFRNTPLTARQLEEPHLRALPNTGRIVKPIVYFVLHFTLLILISQSTDNYLKYCYSLK